MQIKIRCCIVSLIVARRHRLSARPNEEALEMKWQTIPLGGNCEDPIKANTGREEQ